VPWELPSSPGPPTFRPLLPSGYDVITLDIVLSGIDAIDNWVTGLSSTP
jgi:hypothetical protein